MTSPIFDLITGAGKTLTDMFGKVMEQLSATPEQKIQAQQTMTAESNRHLEAIAKQVEDEVIVQLSAKQKELETVVSDLANVREMNTKLQGGKPSWMAKNIGYCIDAFVSLIWGVLTVYIVIRWLHIITSDSKIDMSNVYLMWGALSSVFGVVLQFHRGSSKSSQAKDDTINAMAKTSG